MSRRLILRLCTAFACAALVAACGGDDDDDGGGGGGAEEATNTTEGAQAAPTADEAEGATGNVTFCLGKDTSGNQHESAKRFNAQDNG